MSAHFTVYVGPFFLVPKVSVVRESVERHCTTPSCPQRKATAQERFCSTCGKPIVATPEVATVQKCPRLADVAGDWADYMTAVEMPSGRVVWIANKHDFGYTYSAQDALALLTLDATFLNDSVREFLAAHRDIFAAFHVQYGVELIEGFGAVPYNDL